MLMRTPSDSLDSSLVFTEFADGVRWRVSRPQVEFIVISSGCKYLRVGRPLKTTHLLLVSSLPPEILRGGSCVPLKDCFISWTRRQKILRETECSNSTLMTLHGSYFLELHRVPELNLSWVRTHRDQWSLQTPSHTGDLITWAKIE